MNLLKRLAPWLATFAILLFLGYFYLWPASEYLLKGNSTRLLTDGGDGVPLPFHYHAIQDAFEHHFSWLLYGAVYTPQLNAPTGYALWIPFIERITVILASPFVDTPSIPTVFTWTLMLLSGMMTFAIARLEKWNWPLSMGVAICFAFNSYIRARGNVHHALASIYYLPAVFLALRLLQKSVTRRASIVASGLLLFAVLAAHYYLMILAAISPFLVWYYLREYYQPANRWASVRKPLVRAVLVSLPALFFMVWSVTQPVPSQFRQPDALITPPPYGFFLVFFSAKPIDYLAHDVAFGSRDLNPIREKINEEVLHNLRSSNPPERSNGIRWFILFPALAFLIVWLIPGRRRRLSPELRDQLKFFFFFGIAAYWISLSPRSFSPLGHGIGPSAWVHWLMPSFRVPSRVGPLVHFSLLMVFGYMIQNWLDRHPRWMADRKVWLLAAISFPALMVFDYAPIQPLYTVAVGPPRTAAILPDGTCGTGMYFPYLGPGSGKNMEGGEAYLEIQRLRETSCKAFNRVSTDDYNTLLIGAYSVDPFTEALKRDDAQAMAASLKKFAECQHLDWIVFRKLVPPSWWRPVCDALGWDAVSEDTCRARALRDPLAVEEGRRCQFIVTDAQFK